MARTSKQGLDYFPMDIDMFNDIKIRKLIKYQGGKSISIFTLLLCNIYKNGYYIEWDEELPFICSELTGFDEAYISEVIKTCLTLGLFSKQLFDEEGVLTSRGIQERYGRICVLCRRVCNITDYNLLVEQSPKQKPKRNTAQPSKDTKRADKPQRCEPYSITLDQEIETMKGDECWLDQLQVLHHMDISQLQNHLDDFRVQCMADGKERHQSLQDAKQHFNSWLRIVNKNKAKDDTDKPKGRNKRRGNVLLSDEKKTYGDSF